MSGCTRASLRKHLPLSFECSEPNPVDTIHEERLRQALVDELTALFAKGGLKIIGAAGSEHYDAPPRLKNEGYGDQEDKRPDVFALDEKTGQYVIGIARLGPNDLETDHALTQ